MKNSNRFSRLLFAVVMVGLFHSFAAQASLIINGGFEEPVVVGTYEHRNGNELLGWTSFSSWQGIVQFNSLYAVGPSEGTQAVQLEQPGDWISQSFSTTIGQTYMLSFDLSTYATPSTISVTVGPAFEMLGAPSEIWIPHTLQFTADSLITTLEFKSAVGFGNQFPQLDNVSVNAVPIPTAFWLFGSALFGLLGFLRRGRFPPR